MARFGFGRNGGATLGDVADALGGQALGYSPLTYAISPAKAVVDASLGRDFAFKMVASSIVKVANPTNAAPESEIVFHILGITTFGTLAFDTLYQTTAALATFSTGKVKSIAFRWNGLSQKWTEVWRTTSKSG